MKRADCQLAKPFEVFDLFGERITGKRNEKQKGVSQLPWNRMYTLAPTIQKNRGLRNG